MIRIFAVIYAFLIVRLEGGHEYSMCKEISEMRRESIYKEFDSLYRQYNNEVFYSRGITQEPHVVRHVNIDLLRDKGKCFDINSNTTTSSQIQSVAICPWTYKIKKRSNASLGLKYPTLRREAHCMCDSCHNKSNESFKCMPILQAMTCLERSNKCDHEGYYKWIPNIEMISVGCVCALNIK